MAKALFSSLLIGVILKSLFELIHWAPLEPVVRVILAQTKADSPVIGAVIGVAIAYAIGAKQLVLFSSAVVGAIAYVVSENGVSAGPVGAYLAVCVAAGLAKRFEGKTVLDILLIPSFCLIVGAIVALLLGPMIAGAMLALGAFVNEATRLQPLLMGMLVSVLMSLILFSPFSSAALSIMLGLSGLAGGAATAGCCASMIGYAAASVHDNNVGGILAQALGTSMLQIGNTFKHPVILLPSTVAALVVGPLSTLLFHMENGPLGSGMGTSGLVGPILTWQMMMGLGEAPFTLFLKMLTLYFLLPALISYCTMAFMYRMGWIKRGYYAL